MEEEEPLLPLPPPLPLPPKPPSSPAEHALMTSMRSRTNALIKERDACTVGMAK